jgi:hypothetical protein
MHRSIAVFPWLESTEPTKVGSIRLIPYAYRKSPGNQPTMTQVDIDGVLRAYSRKPSSRDRNATILEVGRWRMGMQTPPRIISRLFRIRELVAFSALAKRRFFTHTEYCNYHTYTLVVQRFAPGQTGTFAFSTRRRDGQTSFVWGSDEFAFHIPNHVRADARMRLDTDLLRALAHLPKSMEHLVEAIREFNAANTDSSEVPERVEVVMMKSAFEWLLRVDHTADEFRRALSKLLADVPAVPANTGNLTARWRQRWAKDVRIIDAWARDFCVVVSPAAYGVHPSSARVRTSPLPPCFFRCS